MLAIPVMGLAVELTVLVEEFTRAEYYNVPYVTWFLFDGILYLMDYIPFQLYEDAYHQRKLVPTDVSLTHTGTYNTVDGHVDFSVTASTESALPPGDYRIHIVLTESGLEWAAPNGTNIHNHTMRSMIPNDKGRSSPLWVNSPKRHRRL